MHDVVKVCDEISVRRNVLSPFHDPADELIGMKLSLFVALCQHGGLQVYSKLFHDGII